MEISGNNMAFNAADLLSGFTLVVPTFNRPEHLFRLLSHYKNMELAMSILVLDSSSEETQVKNRDLVESLGGNARHIVYAPEVPVATKLMRGLLEVKTLYCGFCADDDLVFIDGLVAALTYLVEHPEYVCVDGIYLNYWKVGNDVNMRIEYGGEGIEAHHPCARVFRLMQKYESLFYGVFRTENLRRIFRGVSDIPTLHFQELFQAVSALLLGKSHRLPLFYGARHSCDPAQPERDKWQTYYWFADDRSEFIEHYTGYRSHLWQFYSNYGASPRLLQSDFDKAMDLAHTVFFSAGCPPWYFFSCLQELWPEDTFQNCVTGNEMLDRLKNSGQTHKEMRIKDLIGRLEDKIRRHYMGGILDDLNAQIQSISGNPWNCVLHNNLEWLAGTLEFRSAYLDLCRHLDCGVSER